MKGAAEFLMKGLYLILAIIIISLFLNQLVAFQQKSTISTRSVDLQSSPTKIIQTLSGSEKCLAFKEGTKVEGTDVSLPTQRILDSEKLNNFEENYFDLQPACARSKFGYRITVETEQVSIKTIETQTKGGVFADILNRIDGKKVTFIADITGSMLDDGGTFEGKPITKIDCLKKFLEAFADNLSPGTGFALYTFGDFCEVKKRSDLVILDGDPRSTLKGIIGPLPAYGNTPLELALEEGFSYSKQNNIDTMVFLTDGQDTCGGSAPRAAGKHKNDGIVVHTIAFGRNADIGPLKEVADITGGEFFDARTCEDLISIPKEKIDLNLVPSKWEFGNIVFSKDSALREKVSTLIPVSVRIDKDTILPAKMKISVYDGELETFTNLVEDACVSGQTINQPISVSYPVSWESRDGKNHLCMQFPDGKECRKVYCDKDFEFDGIKTAGKYNLNILVSRDIIRINA